MEGNGSGTPDTTVKPSEGVVGLIQGMKEGDCSGSMVGQSCCCA